MTYERPEIKTALPGPKAVEMVKRDKAVMSTSFSREYPFVMDHGTGVWLFDVDGNRFMDLAAGIAVSTMGHSHPEIIKAIKDQADQYVHVCSPVFYTPIQTEYAEKLMPKVKLKGTGASRVFFGNSGVEAWEGAIKLARYHTKRQNIICFYGAFHGRTLAAISANSTKVIYRENFGPLLPGIFHAFYPKTYKCPHDAETPTTVKGCLDYITEHLFKRVCSPKDTAAICVEPVQGEGGYLVPSKEFMQGLRKICDEHGILLIADEVQSGFGRTGKLFAMEHFDVEPDIICAAKGIASGMPLSAFMAKESVMNWPEAVHGSTFGGNPVSIAAAIKTLELLESGVMKNAEKVGKVMLSRLQKMQHPAIGEVRGLGLMIGVEIVKHDSKGPIPDPQAKSKLLQEGFKRGLVMLGCGTSSIRFAPPLVLSEAEANVAMDLFEDAVKSL